MARREPRPPEGDRFVRLIIADFGSDSPSIDLAYGDTIGKTPAVKPFSK